MKTTTFGSVDVLASGRATTSTLKAALGNMLARWTDSGTATDTAELVREDLGGLDDHLLRDIGVLDAAQPRRGH